MDQKLRTERRKLADLKAAEYNPRKALTPDDAEYQKIRRSIEEFGYVDPIIINEDGTIIGGHQRATVLKDLGYQEVDVVVVALDKQREKALNIALNKITGEWDEVKLKDLLLDLDLGDYDISLTGFEQNDLTELVDKLAIEPEAVDDDFNEDEALEQAEAEPVTKLGDVWLLGRHRLMCGDSTSQDDMAVLMNGEIADLVVTDPPYNVNYGDKAEMLDEYLPAKGHRNINHIKNDNMDNQSFYSFLLATYQSAYEFMRAGAAIYVFHAESTGHIFRQAFLDAGLKLAQCLIWEKNAFVLGRQDYQWRHEPCLYGWKEGAAHYFINDRTQDTVILEQYIDRAGKQDLIKYSYGEFLDNLGAGRGVTRKQPAPAETTLRFTLSEKRPAAVGIPEGTKVTDGNLNYFATVGYEEIPAGETYVDVRALCTENGVDGNELLPGQVNVLVDLIPYVESVSNTTKTSGGADLESDESLAERIFLAPSGYSVAGPDDAYKYWTKTYSQTIGDVKVTSPNPVEVEIRFIMTDGELPTKTVIDGVAAYLQDENIRPLTDKVTVLAPETVKFNIAFTYYVNLSDQSKAGTIQAEVAQAVADYIEWQTRTIGRDINPSELMKRIVAAGAKRAEITSPVFTTVPDTSVARIGTQTVTYGGVEND